AGIHAEAAHDAPQHVDLELHRVLLDPLVRLLARHDVDTIGMTDRRAHVTCDAFGRAVGTLREHVHAAEALAVVSLLLGVADRRRELSAQVRDHVLERDAEPFQRRGHGAARLLGHHAHAALAVDRTALDRRVQRGGAHRVTPSTSRSDTPGWRSRAATHSGRGCGPSGLMIADIAVPGGFAGDMPFHVSPANSGTRWARR